jgi:hypothetical protein
VLGCEQTRSANAVGLLTPTQLLKHPRSLRRRVAPFLS